MAAARTAQLASAGQPHERQCASAGRRGILPGVRQPIRARELEHAHRRLRAVRTDDLQTDPRDALQRLPPRDERGEHDVAELTVLVEERAQRSALDRDIPQRLGHERVDEDRLPREQVQLPEEAGRAVPDDLVPRRVDDRDLPLANRDERVDPIAHPVQQLTGGRRALLADLGQSRQLRRREKWARGC